VLLSWFEVGKLSVLFDQGVRWFNINTNLFGET
jgi:hypothetical protein